MLRIPSTAERPSRRILELYLLSTLKELFLRIYPSSVLCLCHSYLRVRVQARHPRETRGSCLCDLYVNWTEIITVLLSGDIYPKTGAQILDKETVHLMLSNNIEKFLNSSHQPIPAAKPDLSVPIVMLYPVNGDLPQV